MKRCILLLTAALLALCGCSAPAPSASSDAAHDVSILFINVGKADAALLRADGKSYLIDTGAKESTDQLFAALDRFNVTKLDGVFLTHTHDDHTGGMKQLCQSREVARLYTSVYSLPNKKGENKLDKLAEKYSLPQTRLSAGESVPIADGVSLDVLGPLSLNAGDDNDNSLVLRLSVNGVTVLMTGDMQFDEEKALIASGAELKADILKVGNHGNPDATSEEFAAAVAPSLAMISTDTAVDADSANPRVTALFSSSLLTQDAPLGWYIALNGTDFKAERL